MSKPKNYVGYNAKGEAILVPGDLDGPQQADADRAAFVAGLRQLANLLEKVPACPLPENYGGVKFTAEVSTLEELRAACHLSGPWEKDYQGEIADYRKELATKEGLGYFARSPFPLTYTVRIKREEVCKKRVVGREYIPPTTGHYVPPSAGYYKDNVEWECI